MTNSHPMTHPQTAALEACKICNGSQKVRVGWSPVNNIKIRLEYDPCPNCTPGPHGFYAKQSAERIRALIATPDTEGR